MQFISLLLSLQGVCTCAGAQAVSEDDPVAAAVEAARQAAAERAGERVQGPCAFSEVQLPSDLVVIAVGAYRGKSAGFQIDQSGNEATLIDVNVHGDHPIALMLSAYDPTIWSIHWTHGTRVVATYITGYHRQVVAGLPKGVPSIVSTYDGQGQCGWGYFSDGNNLEWLNPASRRTFGVNVTQAYLPNKYAIADIVQSSRPKTSYQSSDVTAPESFRDRDAPLAGQAGLNEAVAKGLIRPATPADMAKVRERMEADLNSARKVKDGVPPLSDPDPAPPLPPMEDASRTYVVLKPFRFPAGLFGANSARFIVPKGVPRPTGNRGHSDILDMNRETLCFGQCD